MKARTLQERVDKAARTEFVHLEAVLRRALKVDERELSRVLGNKDAREELLRDLKTQGAKDDVGTLEVSAGDVAEVVKRYQALREAPPVEKPKSKWLGKQFSDMGAGILDPGLPGNRF